MAIIERVAGSLSLWGHIGNRAIIALAVVGTLAAVPRAHGQAAGPAAAAGYNPAGAPLPAPGDQAGAGDVAGRAWTVTPSVELSTSFTDNVRGSATNRQSDFYTTVAPGIFITGKSRRLRGTLDYSPQLIRHIEATDQDRIDQNFFGSGTATLIPDFFYFDANGSISNASRSGSRGFGNTSEIPSNDVTQTVGYSASPYLQFHLGRAAETELRYRYAETDFSQNTGPVTSQVTGQTLGALSNTREQEAYGRVVSSDLFSRLQLGFTGDYLQQDSADNLTSSRDSTGTLDASYRVLNDFWALLDGGYEHLVYPRQTGINYTGPIWDIGARYEHNEKQTVSLTYGEHQGHRGFSGQLRYALTPATSIYTTYTQRVTTPQQQLLQNLGNATQTTAGLTIDQTTGLPLAINNPNLNLQNSVFLSRTLTAGVTSGIGRNHYNLYFDRTENEALSGLSTNQTTTGGFFSWDRELSPRATGTMLVGYSTTTPGSANIIDFALTYTYSFSDSLSAGGSYGMSYSTGGNSASVLTDLVTLNVRKSF